MGVSQLSKFPFDDLVIRKNVKSGEASTTIAAGDVVKFAFLDDTGTVLQAGADDPGGPLGIAETAILAGKSGYILIRGYTTVKDLNGLADGDILAPDAAGALTAANADQERRIAQVVDASEDILYFNGLAI
jgi:hypothetical protein